MNDNKLIAEFMEVHEIMHDGYSEYDFDDNTLDVVKEDELQYHTSWNSLMPVVEKIEDYLADNVGKVGYFDECLSSNDLEVRHQAVVEFINQYNKNQ